MEGCWSVTSLSLICFTGFFWAENRGENYVNCFGPTLRSIRKLFDRYEFPFSRHDGLSLQQMLVSLSSSMILIFLGINCKNYVGLEQRGSEGRKKYTAFKDCQLTRGKKSGLVYPCAFDHKLIHRNLAGDAFQSMEINIMSCPWPHTKGL